MTVKVVDASILAAILFGEPAAEQAANSIEGCTLVAPFLLPHEIASVARKKIVRRLMAYDEVLRAVLKYDEFEVRLMHVDPVGILETANAHRLSTYDASYLWLARNFQCELVTLDARLKAASVQS